ncbi:MAG: DNA protecting protein DprA [Candidatus Lloydbacteria bacterium RIFCSPHIGHO2_02_FULL_54_17]|uniref:DNA protecting protein DprA n=1 Tax=Candidatus Lloydbacteria bacterium RIFCSPHIGHO2_02_FULL_54_17 TaxID=1798664 RepID=A0A1G2DFQ2_9BACT|nr:MAG: DNA protecting protein DprA [Candidatus Lloydbacteria bacterium RIFCSPHIGHO2_02_FULL_54_17]OGZ14723.1 MAG: DNA protecting protein DprA [Candidatus Lloydbacteria bacterium RIFCSPLOWO2_01_FULL_54_18]OGZ16751.1 MAG: DNA protecting protein DprA [Candidatus Lloydbacteria bacterium RIFCSPLOWO2_02_FULL_54_12]
MWKPEKLDNIPPQLLEIPEPPKELWVAGVLPSSETVLLTVVGSRKYTSYGKEACEELISGLCGYDIAVVSGLALGIDTIAHEAAMATGLPTIAVPGSGLDPSVLYPRSNLGLAKRILDSGGALLSEFAPDFRAADWSFPQRNRIMAGLAKATLLIEAGERSGTLITARLAADYNREVLVVPGSIFSPTSRGTHQFLKLGATPVTSSEEILRVLGFEPEIATPKDVDLATLSEAERAVMEFLTEPRHRDLIIEELKLPTSEANVLLMKMEIAGLIRETPEGLRRA